MNDYTTKTRMSSVFKCKNNHMVPGSTVLRVSGYICPFCKEELTEDITFTEEGRAYHAQVRGDLTAPPPQGSA